MLLSEGYLAMLSMIETVNNAKIYGSAFINGPDHATDLDGNFVNRQAVQDAGINTILLAAPAIGAELKAMQTVTQWNLGGGCYYQKSSQLE